MEAVAVTQEPGTLVLLRPRGFCAGVVRAIDVVRLALEKLGKPVYVRKEIVHNQYVVQELAAMGAIFVEELDEVPEGAVVIFSAHGVSPQVRRHAKERNLRVIDATCPLVTKVHVELIRYVQQGYSVVLIGHRDHDEVIGTLGEAPGQVHLISSADEVDSISVPDPERLAYLTQTTLSIDDTAQIVARLKQRFPTIVSPPNEDICYATQNRQTSVKSAAPQIDLLLVVGARNSSNSNRLREIGAELGKPSYLIDDASDLDHAWFEGVSSVGVTAGASAPEMLVQGVLDGLRAFDEIEVTTLDGVAEDVRFRFPAEVA